MGIILFIGFCLITLIVVCAIIGANGASKTYHGTSRFYYDEDDEDDSFGRGSFSSGESADDDDGELYGGIPFGDGKIYMTDDDDFIDEFGDDVL